MHRMSAMEGTAAQGTLVQNVATTDRCTEWNFFCIAGLNSRKLGNSKFFDRLL